MAQDESDHTGGDAMATIDRRDYSSLQREHYRDVAFTPVDPVADGRELVLDAALVNDTPRILFDLDTSRSLSFAMCGSMIERRETPMHADSRVATLVLRATPAAVAMFAVVQTR